MIHGEQFYCSNLSRENAEQMFGTASVASMWMLLEYSNAWWPEALIGCNLSERVKLHLDQMLQSTAKSRLLFIKQDRLTCANVACFVAVCKEEDPRLYRITVEDYEDLLHFDLSTFAAHPPPEAVRIHDPLLLVCTHGKHDKCCAKYGLPAYNILRLYTGELAWQSTHVGGDRFAANIVCLPHGLFFGHVSDTDIPQIADELRQGRICLDKYRGRSCYSRFVQVGEYFVRLKSGINQIEALRFHKSSYLGSARWRIAFLSKIGHIHEAVFRTVEAPFRNYLTCSSSEPRAIQQYELEDYSKSA